MRVFLIAALALCIPATAIAQAERPYPVKDVERIFRDAEVICPLDSSRSDSELIEQIAKAKGYTIEERTLLYNYCLMYLAGRKRELTRQS